MAAWLHGCMAAWLHGCMAALGCIIIFGIGMSAIALIGAVTLILSESMFEKIIIPLVSLAAGTLIGGAFFQLLPEAINKLGNIKSVYAWLLLDLLFFLSSKNFYIGITVINLSYDISQLVTLF